MYETIRNMYLGGRMTDTQLTNAVTKKYITQAQADQIRADKAAQDADKLALENALLSTLDAPA